MATTATPVAVRIKAGAGRERVGGVYPGPLGPAIIIEVKERAVDGAATRAACRALARALGVAPAEVSLKRGRRSRDKLLEVAREPADLAERLAELRQG